MEYLYAAVREPELAIKVPKKVEIRYLEMPQDLEAYQKHLQDHDPDYKIPPRVLRSWDKTGPFGIKAQYIGLFVKEEMIARGCIERYSENAWEAADIRVVKRFRGKDYGKMITRHITMEILSQGRVATCRTKETNLVMQHILQALGYTFLREI